VGTGWRIFKRDPATCIALWVLCILFSGGGAGGSGGSIGIDLLLGVISWSVNFTSLFIGPVIRASFQRAYVQLVRGQVDVEIGSIFSGFDRFQNLLVTALYMGLIIFAGLLFCIVPGVIAILGLWPALLLVLEDDLSPDEAISQAWALTRGYKLQLFGYGIVVLIMQFVGLLACCVGLFVAGPVAELGWLTAYDELRKSRADR